MSFDGITCSNLLDPTKSDAPQRSFSSPEFRRDALRYLDRRQSAFSIPHRLPHTATRLLAWTAPAQRPVAARSSLGSTRAPALPPPTRAATGQSGSRPSCAAVAGPPPPSRHQADSPASVSPRLCRVDQMSGSVTLGPPSPGDALGPIEGDGDGLGHGNVFIPIQTNCSLLGQLRPEPLGRTRTPAACRRSYLGGR